MIKKIALSLVIGLFTVGAQAATYSCGYKDYFHLSDKTDPAVYIMSGYGDTDVYFQIIGPRSFILRDSPHCLAGYAHVQVVYDAYRWCVLDVKDGPYMSHPKVSASCTGLKYLGTSYDGVGSYSYSIKIAS